MQWRLWFLYYWRDVTINHIRKHIMAKLLNNLIGILLFGVLAYLVYVYNTPGIEVNNLFAVILLGSAFVGGIVLVKVCDDWAQKLCGYILIVGVPLVVLDAYSIIDMDSWTSGWTKSEPLINRIEITWYTIIYSFFSLVCAFIAGLYVIHRVRYMPIGEDGEKKGFDLDVATLIILVSGAVGWLGSSFLIGQ